MQNKKAAIELSISTVVVIVIAMSMLILGLVLVRSIFTGAQDSVETLNDKVKNEIVNIFSEEGRLIALKLGSDKLVKIKQGSNGFGVGFGAQTPDGAFIDEQHELKYKLSLTGNECGNTFEDYISYHDFNTAEMYSFEQTEYSKGFSILFFNIPPTQPKCIERIRITLYYKGNQIANDSFRVQVVSGGIFS